MSNNGKIIMVGIGVLLIGAFVALAQSGQGGSYNHSGVVENSQQTETPASDLPHKGVELGRDLILEDGWRLFYDEYLKDEDGTPHGVLHISGVIRNNSAIKISEGGLNLNFHLLDENGNSIGHCLISNTSLFGNEELIEPYSKWVISDWPLANWCNAYPDSEGVPVEDVAFDSVEFNY